jgi:hypothetical protein
MSKVREEVTMVMVTSSPSMGTGIPPEVKVVPDQGAEHEKVRQVPRIETL